MKNLILCLVLFLLLPAASTSQVKINEVLYNTATTGDDRIELKNFGSTSVDVSGWWFCNLGTYIRIDAMTVVSGTLNIPPGGILALSGRSLNNTLTDLGLYNDEVVAGSSAEFANASLMEDFVQWGAGGLSRESVAVSKGIWSAGDFVPTVASAGNSIEYDGEGNSASDWFDQANPTIGAENGIVTSVNDDLVGIPDEFILAQNYPNPFNPETTIRYELPEAVNVLLVIYDNLGREVTRLVDGTQGAGVYHVVWDARRLPSGVYSYRLKAGPYTQSKQMVLMK